jgi:hypothetical protein
MFPCNRHQEAALALRRKRLEERKKLIFDPKARKMAVDPETLKQQMEEKRTREQQERAFDQLAGKGCWIVRSQSVKGSLGDCRKSGERSWY